jgi:hypothetical protein
MQIFAQLGLSTADWTALETIDAGCAAAVLAQQEVLENLLPKRVVGNLSLLHSDIPLTRRKSLLSFCRRLAAELDGAIIRRRTQKRVQNKTISKYSYRLIRA